jgi:adenylate cyclase
VYVWRDLLVCSYVSPEIADKLVESGSDVLGGRMVKCTVLFSDIRSFTTITERIGPVETVQLLNDYFSIMVDIVLENHGILDKVGRGVPVFYEWECECSLLWVQFIGDAIMAVFGAPFETDHDADNCVQAAIAMMVALYRLNKQRREEGKVCWCVCCRWWTEPDLFAMGRGAQDEINIGIGINTDYVISGNIGAGGNNLPALGSVAHMSCLACCQQGLSSEWTTRSSVRKPDDNGASPCSHAVVP